MSLIRRSLSLNEFEYLQLIYEVVPLLITSIYVSVEKHTEKQQLRARIRTHLGPNSCKPIITKVTDMIYIEYRVNSISAESLAANADREAAGIALTQDSKHSSIHITRLFILNILCWCSLFKQ